MDEESEIVDTVLSKVKKDPLAADLRISLFMSALQNYRHHSLLRPFPPGYLNENGEKNIDRLREVASKIPGINELSNSKHIANDVWKLIHWITDLKNMEVEQSPTASKFDEITNMTENSSNFHTPSHIFEIKYNEMSNARFQELCQGLDILYGYHGSRVENFYSILHNGLHAHLNKTSLFGEGTYLSSDLNVSIMYSKFGKGWKYSLLGEKLSCIAVCEIIDHPDVKRSVQGPAQRSRSRAENSEGGDVPERYFVVTNNQLVRVKYIMVYASQSGIKRSFGSLKSFKSREGGWRGSENRYVAKNVSLQKIAVEVAAILFVLLLHFYRNHARKLLKRKIISSTAKHDKYMACSGATKYPYLRGVDCDLTFRLMDLNIDCNKYCNSLYSEIKCCRLNVY